MRGQLGIRRIPRGGFGNRVMTYVSLRQIALEIDAGYFSINPADRNRISGINKRWLLPLGLRKLREISKDEVLEPGFLESIGNDVRNGTTALFKHPLLGEVLARNSFRDPRSFASHSMSICRGHREQHAEGPWVALHLRGTDFASWNPDAILGPAYYLDALERLSEESIDFNYRICTDDTSHPAWDALQSHLKSTSRLIESNSCESPFECDFAAMANSAFLIASPSTFAITAGMLGHTSTIHSKSWVDNRQERGELFWNLIAENQFPFYSVAGIV